MANNIMELDFTGVESFNNIGEGTHTVKVSDALFAKAKTGSDQLEVTFEASDGATRKTWYNLQPQALWKVKGFLEAIGIPADGKIKLNTRSIIGKCCQIVVEPDPSDDTRLVISKVVKIANSTPEVVYNTQQAMPAPMQPQTIAPQPASIPAQPQTNVPTGNLPPWMQQPAQNPQAPMGNLPPWMQQK